MKPIVLLLVVIGVWFAYRQSQRFIAGSAQAPKKTGALTQPGVQSTLSRGFGSTGSFRPSGSSSPGSGVPAIQPQLISSYAIAGGLNIGMMGVSYEAAQ
jgi:hypothetical protein